jgi:hypothetical protein
MSYLRGEGHNVVGPFTIAGWCDTRTGVVGVTNAYEV